MYVYKLALNILNVMLASESKQKLELSLKVINTPPPSSTFMPRHYSFLTEHTIGVTCTG